MRKNIKEREQRDEKTNKKAKSNHQINSSQIQETTGTKNTNSTLSPNATNAIRCWHERIKVNSKLIHALLFSTLFAILHFKHLQNLFENDKHFSHLSELERELSFRSEAGLYYHYFKRLVVDANRNSIAKKSFFQLINDEFLNDNRTEHPLTINALQRFNLYPELVLASLYRLCDHFELLSKQCWGVKRGDNMPQIESCVGLAEPIYFYTNSVFVLNAFFMLFLFLLCWQLNNESLLAGFLACVCYFYNHSEATRVMWTPALRENFSFPFHMSQLLALVYYIKSEHTKGVMTPGFVTLSLTTLVYLLPWQFAQFSLATQVASLFASYSLGFLDKHKFLSILKAHFLSLTACFLFMFFNRMLISSLYAALLLSAVLMLLLDDYLFHLVETSFSPNVKWLKKLFLTFLKCMTFVLVTFLFKKCFLDVLIQSEDDSHIWDILKSKLLPDFQTFHTRLYTCAREFDFLDANTFKQLTYTLTLPLALFIFVFYLIKCLIEFFSSQCDNADQSLKDIDEYEARRRSMGLLMYCLTQMCAFSLMALLIMRLKLFWTPFLCVFCSFLANPQEDFNLIDSSYHLITKQRLNKWSKYALIAGVLACMSIGGLDNLNKQFKIIGEYSNYDMELMMNWISKHTKHDDAFAGSMSIMANIKLSTNRPITNHPHYEDVDLRNRTELIYSRTFGYRPIQELHELLKKIYQAKYLVFEADRCDVGKRPSKCSMTEISHISLLKTSMHMACDVLLRDKALSGKYFQKVFMRGPLVIFKVV